MTVDVRVGAAADVAATLAVYERSNLARRQGVWPERAERVRQVETHLRRPDTWLVIAADGPLTVAMASVTPLRDRAGAAISGGCLFAYLYVLPECWEGIGGAALDAVVAEARRRRYARSTCGRTTTTSARTASTAAAAPP